jgi:hypothetical protein
MKRECCEFVPEPGLDDRIVILSWRTADLNKNRGQVAETPDTL